MGRIRIPDLYLFLLLITFFLVTACSSTNGIVEAPADSVCISLVDEKCVRCHYKTRICDALGTKSVSGWKKSIKYMVRQGAELTEEELQKMVACLSSMPAGSDIVCK